MSTDELPTRFAVKFLSYELLKTRKRRIFLPTSYIQGQEVQEAKEAIESARAGLSQKRKEKKRPRKARRWLREGKVLCVLNQEFLFWFTSIWVLRDPTRLKYRLLRHFYTRKPCAKEVPETDYFTQ